MNPVINYKEHCKLRIVDSDPSFFKHEVVKLLVMLISKSRYKKAGIYSEYALFNEDRPDVCVDLGKEMILYEIQKEISPKWLDSVRNRDLELGVNTIVIPLKNLSDNMPELLTQLEEMCI